jgi:hypothetical protein
MLTPRIVRVLDLDVDDLRPFRVGRDASGGVYELPLPAPQPRRRPAAGRRRRRPGIFRPGRPRRPAPAQIPAATPTTTPTTRPPAMRRAHRPTTRPPQ